jgi:YD repeat-containing protein
VVEKFWWRPPAFRGYLASRAPKLVPSPKTATARRCRSPTPPARSRAFAYDPFGKLIKTTDAAGNVVTATYDVRGRKIASHDPDLGAWTYAYDTANELVSQTDAKSQTTSPPTTSSAA